MSGFYRAVFVCKGHPGYLLTVDLAILGDGTVSKMLLMSGWWGNSESADVWPFILRMDGEMDFGNTSQEPYEDLARFGNFDVHQKPISGNEVYCVKYKDESYSLRLYDLKNHDRFSSWHELKPSTTL